MIDMRIKKNDMPVKEVDLGETWGTAIFLNWKKLTEVLRRRNLIRENEYVKGVNINEAGVGIYVGNDDDPQSDTYERPLGE